MSLTITCSFFSNIGKSSSPGNHRFTDVHYLPVLTAPEGNLNFYFLTQPTWGD